MADAQRTIDLIFNGVDKTGAATLSALSNADSFATKLQTITQPISDFTVGAVKLEAGLLAAGVAMTTFAVKAASDFDTNFRQISTIVDASDADLNAFKESILEYASSSTQPLERITDALAAAIGSGVDYADSLSLISVAEKLSVATRADLQSTTKVLVSTMNSYGLEMADVGKLSDIFFKIIDDGDISMDDLAASFAKVAPVAKLAGVPIEELGAAIATLTAAGIAPAESIEAVRAAIGNIISPSKEASDLAGQLGINFTAAGLKAEGFSGLLQIVAEKTGGNAEQMKTLFGSINGFTAAATLAGPQADNFSKTLKSMGDVAGATDAAFAKMSGSLDVAGGKISAAFNALLVGIGTPLLDEFAGAANAIAAIFTALGVSVKEGALKDLVAYVEGLFGQLQDTLATVAKNLPAALAAADFSGFKGGIDAVVGAFKTLFGNIDLTTVGGLTRAIELAGAAFLGLSKFTAGVIESFKPLFDMLVKIAGQVEKSNLDWVKAAGNIAGAVVQFNALLGIFGGLVPVLSTIVGLMVANQGASLVSALITLSGLLPSVAVGMAAVFTPLTATVAAAAAIGVIIPLLLQWKAAQDQLTEAQQRAEALQVRATDTLTRFAETTGIAVKSLEDANKLVEDGQVEWSTATNGWVKAGAALSDTSIATQKAHDQVRELDRELRSASAATDAATTKTEALAKSHGGLAEYVMKAVPIIDAATGKIVGYEQQLVKASAAGIALGKAADEASTPLRTSGDVMDQLGRKTNLTNAELITLAKNTRDAEIELEKLASNERLKIMEFAVQLNVANIEAQTKRIEASFESIDNAINASSKNLDTLYGLMGSFDGLSWSAQDIIESQMDIQNERLDKQLELQEKLITAQIDYMRAQTQAMLKGDAMIKVDGAGLKPHLEAFMWEILKAVQVKVNQQGLSMLLGIA